MVRAHDPHDPQAHERRLAEALGALVQQIDISDYRDAQGHPLKTNLAFQHAQALVDEFGVTHEDICRVLEACGDDYGTAARQLLSGARDRATAALDDIPPEYQPWRSGP
jgi:hypothetical protein